jgi:transglutaminase-like putative cysteine protease
MRRIRIEHHTRYDYPSLVDLLEHKLLIRPREGHDIRIESSVLEIRPAYDILWHRDVHNNSVAMVHFREPSAELVVSSIVVVQHYEEAPLDFVVAPQAERYPFSYDPAEHIDLTPYQTAVFPDDQPTLAEWCAQCWTPSDSVETSWLLDRINHLVSELVEYEVREAPGVQSPAETLRRRSGSCRDMATLFIECCRYLGMATRFVSGYLVSSAASHDYGTTHAWSEVYLPGSGWRGFDSTSGQLVGGDHIAVAVHRHPEAVSPVTGAFRGPGAIKPRMEVEVRVTIV